MNAFSEWLSDARQAAGITQQELADRAELSKPQISRLESGDQTTKRETAIRIATALGRPAAEGLAALANTIIGDEGGVYYAPDPDTSYMIESYEGIVSPSGRRLAQNLVREIQESDRRQSIGGRVEEGDGAEPAPVER
jgi:transcriptional regulator with XRE-family HTH domain